jgi:hypothetical protein
LSLCFYNSCCFGNWLWWGIHLSSRHRSNLLWLSLWILSFFSSCLCLILLDCLLLQCL